MKTSLGPMRGDQWEEYCRALLQLRYAKYQKVPAKFGGDLGIDGLALSSGVVFQCYCPDDDPVGKELYEKQRDKITTDIGKLIKNVAEIYKLNGNTITEWHFVTPDYDNKNLIAHCRLKESEVRQESIAEIAKDFTIVIKTDADFREERAKYVGTGALKIQPSGVRESTTDEEIEKSTSTIVSNINRKIRKLHLPTDTHTELIRVLLTNYVVGRKELEKLNEEFPGLYEQVLKLKSSIEHQLAIQNLSLSPKNILPTTLAEYEKKLDKAFSQAVSTPAISNYAQEAISDWLARCPLDFPDGGANGQS